MFIRTYLFTILYLLLTACSAVNESVTSFMGGEDNAIPPTPLQEIGKQIIIKQIWDTDIGDGSDEQYLKLIPAYENGMIFAAESDGDVIAVNADTGRSVWSEDIDARITGGPGTGEGLVVVGTGEADVIALSADDGTILWQSKVSSEILATPKISSGTVVIRTVDGKIFGLKVEDGGRLWVYDRTVPTLTLRGTSAPVVEDGVVIAGFDEGRLTAIELQSGKTLWETRVALGSGRTELERMVDIDSDPVIRDGLIYVASFQGRVAALTVDSGRIVWTRDIPSYAGISVDEKHVYISDDESIVWALDRDSGNSVWKNEDLKFRAVTAPGLHEDAVVVGDIEGYLHWLNRDTGTIVGRTRLSSSQIIVSPFTENEIAYAYASDGNLGAYNYQVNPEYVVPVVTDVTENIEADDSENSEEQTTDQEQLTADAGVKEEEIEEEAIEEVAEEDSLLDKLLNVFGGDDETIDTNE